MSVVDQRPEELVAAAAMGVQVQYAAGLGPTGNASSLRFSVESVQIDDDIPGTRSARHSEDDISASIRVRMWPCSRYALCQLVQGLPYLHTGAGAVRPELRASGSAGSLVGDAEAVRDSGKLGG